VINPKKTDQSITFEDGGYVFLKRNKISVCIRIMNPKIEQFTGHIHHDAGSITVSYNGIPIIDDPGTYTYTRDLNTRKKYIEFEYHNVPVIKNETIAGVQMPGYFNVRVENRIEILEKGEYGIKYKHTYCRDEVYRSVSLESDRIVVTDYSAKPILSHFHFHPKVNIEGNKEDHIRWRSGDIKFLFNANNRKQLLGYEYSAGYGRKKQAHKLSIEGDGYNEMSLEFV
jgi:hypothetical protein